MRDIKFRAWNKEKNIMCYRNEDLDADYWDGVYASILEIINDNIKAKRYIFMQYTGLHDKNEKEIYEGDIVELKAENGCCNMLGKIIYDNYDLAFELIDEEGNQEALWYTEQELEVIGNIWEDSDLLNDSKNTKSN